MITSINPENLFINRKKVSESFQELKQDMDSLIPPNQTSSKIEGLKNAASISIFEWVNSQD